MTVAAFNLKYNVVNCGFGMELIQSGGRSADKVKISRVSWAYGSTQITICIPSLSIC